MFDMEEVKRRIEDAIHKHQEFKNAIITPMDTAQGFQQAANQLHGDLGLLLKKYEFALPSNLLFEYIFRLLTLSILESAPDKQEAMSIIRNGIENGINEHKGESESDSE